MHKRKSMTQDDANNDDTAHVILTMAGDHGMPNLKDNAQNITTMCSKHLQNKKHFSFWHLDQGALSFWKQERKNQCSLWRQPQQICLHHNHVNANATSSGSWRINDTFFVITFAIKDNIQANTDIHLHCNMQMTIFFSTVEECKSWVWNTSDEHQEHSPCLGRAALTAKSLKDSLHALQLCFCVAFELTKELTSIV